MVAAFPLACSWLSPSSLPPWPAVDVQRVGELVWSHHRAHAIRDRGAQVPPLQDGCHALLPLPVGLCVSGLRHASTVACRAHPADPPPGEPPSYLRTRPCSPSGTRRLRASGMILRALMLPACFHPPPGSRSSPPPLRTWVGAEVQLCPPAVESAWATRSGGLSTVCLASPAACPIPTSHYPRSMWKCNNGLCAECNSNYGDEEPAAAIRPSWVASMRMRIILQSLPASAVGCPLSGAARQTAYAS